MKSQKKQICWLMMILTLINGTVIPAAEYSNPAASPYYATSPVQQNPQPSAGYAVLQTHSGEVVSVPFGPLMRFDGRFGQGLGYEDSYYNINSFIPWHIEPGESLIFFNFHGAVTQDEGSGVGNFGVGYRRYLPENDHIFGFNGWYDLDDGSENTYQRTGVGVELLSRYLDLRANGYYVVSEESNRLFNTTSADPFFQGNNIFLTNTRGFEDAYSGADVELGGPLPFVGRYGLNFYAGAYYLFNDDVENEEDDTVGFKFRAEALVTDDVTVNVNFTNDDIFGTNTYVSVALTFPDLRPSRWFRAHPNVKSRLSEPVYREYRIPVNQRIERSNIALLDPNDGAPITVVHVDPNSPAFGGTGTFEAPLGDLNNFANDPDIDIIRVIPRTDGTATNLTLDSTLALFDNQRMLSANRTHIFDSSRGTFTLPGSFPNAGLAGPMITLSDTVPSSVISLADNNEISGFIIDGNTIHNGITGTNILGMNINNNTFQNGVNGVQVANVSGTLATNPVIIRNNTFTDHSEYGLMLSTQAGTTTALYLDSNVASNNGTATTIGSTTTLTGGGLMMSINGALLANDLADADQPLGISNNTITNNIGKGMEIDLTSLATSADVAFDSNLISANGTDGLDINMESSGTLTGQINNNTFSDHTNGNGLSITNSSLAGGTIDLDITDNSITGNTGGAGVNIAFQSARMTGNFTGNSVLTNTTGAAIRLAGTSRLDFDEFTANDFSSNSGPGIDLTSIDNAGFTLNVGSDDGANTFDGNGDAAIAIEMDDNSNGLFSINNALITNTIDVPGTSGIQGDGVYVLTRGNSVLGSLLNPVLLQNLTASANAGNGIIFDNQESSIVNGLTIRSSTILNNGLNGILVRRSEQALINPIIGGTSIEDGNLISTNTLDGFRFEVTNKVGVAAANLLVQNNLIEFNENNISLLTAADGVLVANVLNNAINNANNHGLEIISNNNSAIGNPVTGLASVIDGNSFFDNGTAGDESDFAIFVEANNGSFQNIAITGVSQRTTFLDNDNGIWIENNSSFAGATPGVNTYRIQGADFDNLLNNIVLTNNGIGGADFFIGGPGAGEDLFMTNLIGDGLRATINASQLDRANNIVVDSVAMINAPDFDLASAAGDGIDVAINSGFRTNLSINNSTIQRMSESGITISDNSGITNVSITSTESSFNSEEGVRVDILKNSPDLDLNFVPDPSTYTIGGVGQGNIISNNGLQGIFFQQRATADGSNVIPFFNPPVPADTIDEASPDNLIVNLSVSGNQIMSNGNLGAATDATDGFVMSIGSNSLLNALIAGNQFGGNVTDDIRIFPIVSANPAASVNNPDPADPDPPVIDFLVQDPTAHLNLVFGALDTNNDGIPDLTNDPTTINFGNSIRVAGLGSTATDLVTGLTDSGIFTNDDVFKGTNRPVLLNAQVQIVNELNTPFNQFEQFGIFQDIEAVFNNAGFSLVPAEIFPSPAGPPF